MPVSSTLDLDGALPESVTIAFPRLDSSLPLQAMYTQVVTLASLALPEFAGHQGFHGTRFLFSTALAISSGAGVTNAAELLALATQIATDYYRYQAARLDVKYDGIVNWQPEGLTDLIEWTHSVSDTGAMEC